MPAPRSNGLVRMNAEFASIMDHPYVTRIRTGIPILLIAAAILILCPSSHGEDGAAGWLRYARIYNAETLRNDSVLPAAIVCLDPSAVAASAQTEAVRAVRSMLGRTLRIESGLPQEDAFVLGTESEVRSQFPNWQPPTLEPQGYSLTTLHARGHTYWLIAGKDQPGILYGTFHLLMMIAQGEDLRSLDQSASPSAPIRWVNQWDNLDGSITRGYGGRSIFFDRGTVRPDLMRAGEYARLLASIGINGCTVNNVNADPRLLTPEMIQQVARIADAFRPWGVKLSLAVSLNSPRTVGGLDTFDPLDPRVIAWWSRVADEIYREIPDFGGFLLKAGSEGEPGPEQYGRSPAEAANTLARALRPHGGVLVYRAFVYNRHLDWNDKKADRARAAYDIFHPLDGKFDNNVIVQIKYGPIDFQVREPVSPLFAGLRHTNEAIELQVTQEYTGQQRQLVFLVPMWKEILNFDLRAGGRSTPVKQIVEGKSFLRLLGGFVAVANVGLDTNWMGDPLAMANLYGFGRLAWNPDLGARTIASSWTRLTFGSNPVVLQTIDQMLLTSWPIYERYTGPLGLGTLTDILGYHYGPNPQSAEFNGYGQWIRAGSKGVGMDRTVATGTGFIGQFPPEVARIYENLKSCPDSLLLFMHHVPYTYRLHSGETVIQYLYDSHYEGAEEAAGLVAQWERLRGLIDGQRYRKVLSLQKYQAGAAIVWRDAITRWFLEKSGIPDAKGRVGHYPNRTAATSMKLTGYVPVKVTPWETASHGEAVVCKVQSGCSASTVSQRPAGWYKIIVRYFDFHDGASHYTLVLNHQEIGHWIADNTLPGNKINGATSTRYVLGGLPLRPGDTLTVTGIPNGPEPAPLDYIEVLPQPNPGSAHAK